MSVILDEGINNLKKWFVYFLAAALIFKFVILPRMHDPTQYNGRAFSFSIPEGWSRYELPKELQESMDKEQEAAHIEREQQKQQQSRGKSSAPKKYLKPEVVIIAPTDQVDAIVENNESMFPDHTIGIMPDTMVRFLGIRLDQPIWLDIHFPDILQEIAKTGRKIVDKGDFKVNEEVAKWVLTETPRPNRRIILEFYFAPPSKTRQLIKIEYMTSPEHFGKYRPGFEEAKDSITF